MRHHLKKQHECSYLLLFSFQSNNLFSSGEIFTAANVSLLCHVFVIHRGRLPRSIGPRIPPTKKVISSSACLLLHRQEDARLSCRQNHVLASLQVCLKTYLLSPPSLLTSHPLTLTLIQAISSIWRVRQKLLTFNPASTTFLPPQ